MFTAIKIDISSALCPGSPPPGTDEARMQVLCKKTGGNAETHCCVCGQGFVMFWDRQSRSERVAAVHDIQQVLRHHHRISGGPGAHPNDGFMVPEWSGSSARSARLVESTADPVAVPTRTSKA
jgi:hypothetical protein